MDAILVAMTALTLLAYLVVGLFRPQLAVNGLGTTATMFMQAMPWIIVSLFLAGLLAQFLQPAFIARWLGREAGFGAIILGALLGMCGTGSRWAMYPLASGLLAADATPGSVFAFVTTWQLIALPRLPAEVPFYGLRFAIVRAVVSVFVALVGGLFIDVLVARL